MFSHIETDREGHPEAGRRGAHLIRDRLTQIAPVFAKQKYMLGDEFSMLDVAIAPLLWRLDYYGIQLPKQAAPLHEVRRAPVQPAGVHRRADRLRKGDAKISRLCHEKSTKPYLIRAIHEWCSDSGFTPLSVGQGRREHARADGVREERRDRPQYRSRRDPPAHDRQRRRSSSPRASTACRAKCSVPVEAVLGISPGKTARDCSFQPEPRAKAEASGKPSEPAQHHPTGGGKPKLQIVK